MRIQRVIYDKDLSTEINQDQDVDLDLINPIIERYKDKKGNLIPILQSVQNIYGFLPKGAFIKINDELGIDLSAMYGVATFYSQFRLHPVGKNIIKVCHGTACHVQNASKLSESLMEALAIADGETTEDNMFTLESVACLGCCSLAPVMMIGNDTYGKLTGKKAVRIVKDVKLGRL